MKTFGYRDIRPKNICDNGFNEWFKEKIATHKIDQNTHVDDGILSVSDYLAVYEKVIKEYRDEKIYSRGEPEDFYPTCCTPNIFRRSTAMLTDGKEAILFDRLVSNKYQKAGSSNLHIAIEAQHGGLETRLLDVTDNILIGLFFSLIKDIDCKLAKDKHGYVYIYRTKKIYENNDKKLMEHFNDLTNGEIPFKKMKSDFKEAIFIGGNVQNERIQKQQGSFILFYTNDKNVMYRFNKKHLIGRIKVNKNAKQNILNELESYFGITRHYVYPELYNSISEITNEVEKYYDKF